MKLKPVTLMFAAPVVMSGMLFFGAPLLAACGVGSALLLTVSALLLRDAAKIYADLEHAPELTQATLETAEEAKPPARSFGQSLKQAFRFVRDAKADKPASGAKPDKNGPTV